mmetsp:Transcript_40369/g.107062  ORF Transcript_40369/g.107062 Transcript_40369/m.107062 type:complete len:163 (-) Transcript_40369:185-673(-)
MGNAAGELGSVCCCDEEAFTMTEFEDDPNERTVSYAHALSQFDSHILFEPAPLWSCEEPTAGEENLGPRDFQKALSAWAANDSDSDGESSPPPRPPSPLYYRPPQRRVTIFSEDSVHSVIPYEEIYGMHPRYFNFSADGSLLPDAGRFDLDEARLDRPRGDS